MDCVESFPVLLQETDCNQEGGWEDYGENTGDCSDLAAQMAQFINRFQSLEASIASNSANWHYLTVFIVLAVDIKNHLILVALGGEILCTIGDQSPIAPLLTWDLLANTRL